MQKTTSDLLQELKSLSEQYQDKWIHYRRTFHAIPELSWFEEKTIVSLEAILKKIQAETPFPFVIKKIEGALVLDWIFNPSNKMILFRADIDGLPIQEDTNTSFQSTHSGIMHACGHDFHIAMLLGAIDIMHIHSVKPSLNLRFVFQRAEETGLSRCGGKVCVDEGICDDVEAVYGLHISSTLDSGIFFSKPGALLANTQVIDIAVTSSGGHVMHPNEGSNAIDILSNILFSLKGIESQILNPLKQVILVPSMIQAGTAGNIRPNTGSLTLALRSFLTDEELIFFSEALYKKINTIVNSFATANLSKFEINKGYPILINDALIFEQTNSLLKKTFETKTAHPLFAGEDFSYYLKKKPGVYWMLGAKNGPGQDHHSATFNPDESVLWKGVLFWLLIAYESSIDR